MLPAMLTVVVSVRCPNPGSARTVAGQVGPITPISAVAGASSAASGKLSGVWGRAQGPLSAGLGLHRAAARALVHRPPQTDRFHRPPHGCVPASHTSSNCATIWTPSNCQWIRVGRRYMHVMHVPRRVPESPPAAGPGLRGSPLSSTAIRRSASPQRPWNARRIKDQPWVLGQSDRSGRFGASVIWPSPDEPRDLAISIHSSAVTNRERCSGLVVAMTTSGRSRVAACAARITSPSRARSGAVGRPCWRASAQKAAARRIATVLIGRNST